MAGKHSTQEILALARIQAGFPPEGLAKPPTFPVRPEAEQLISQIRECDFLHAVGTTIRDPDIHQPQDWSEAWSAEKYRSWFKLFRHKEEPEILSSIEKQVPDDDRRRFSADVLDPLAQDLAKDLEKKLGPLVASGRLPERVIDVIQFLSVEGIIQAQFNLRTSMCLSLRCLEWVLKGHFPCGWLGNYPEGKLVVY